MAQALLELTSREQPCTSSMGMWWGCVSSNHLPPSASPGGQRPFLRSLTRSQQPDVEGRNCSQETHGDLFVPGSKPSAYISYLNMYSILALETKVQ